jgi:hypothetical protein
MRSEFVAKGELQLATGKGCCWLLKELRLHTADVAQEVCSIEDVETVHGDAEELRFVTFYFIEMEVVIPREVEVCVSTRLQSISPNTCGARIAKTCLITVRAGGLCIGRA